MTNSSPAAINSDAVNRLVGSSHRSSMRWRHQSIGALFVAAAAAGDVYLPGTHASIFPVAFGLRT